MQPQRSFEPVRVSVVDFDEKQWQLDSECASCHRQYLSVNFAREADLVECAYCQPIARRLRAEREEEQRADQLLVCENR